MSFFGGGFPFGAFGGRHGHDDDGILLCDSEDSEPVDNTKYYQILEVSKDASQDQIKSKYKELAKKYHPDRKGGDANKVNIC